MKSLSYWKQFVSTGSIEDYLVYVEKERQDPKPENGLEEVGVRRNAGIYMDNGNDTQTDPYRGVR